MSANGNTPERPAAGENRPDDGDEVHPAEANRPDMGPKEAAQEHQNRDDETRLHVERVDGKQRGRVLELEDEEHGGGHTARTFRG